MTLPERLALEAVRRNLSDIPGADRDVPDEMLPVFYSGLYQLLVAVARAALDEAAKVAREFHLHTELRADAERIAAAIEAL